MKTLLYIITFFYISSISMLYGQSEFFKQYTDVYQSNKRCLVQLSDSGYIVAGQYANPFYFDRTLTRLDKNGNILWEKAVVVSSTDEYSNAIKVTSNNRVLVLGYEGSGISYTHFDFNGNVLINKRLPLSLSGASGNYNFEIIESPDSNIYMLARNYIIKTDLLGNILWIKKYNLAVSEFTNIHCISVNKFILTGNAGNILGINSFNDLVQVCIDSLGAVQWGKAFGRNSKTDETARSSVLTQDNKIVTFAYGLDLGSFIVATDTNGNQLWCKGSYIEFPSFNPIILNDGSIVAASKSNIDGKIYAFKFRSNGDVISVFSIQNPTTLTSIAGLTPTNDSGFYMETHSTLSNNNRIGIKFDNGFHSNCIQSNIIQNLPQPQQILNESIILNTPVINYSSSSNTTPTLITLSPSTANFCSSSCDVLSNFVPNQTKICENTTVTFTNTSSNGTSFKWFIDDTLVSTLSNINYTFNDSGIFIVKLVSTGLFCSDSSYCQVEVESLPSPTFNYNNTNLKVFYEPHITSNLIEWDCGDSSTVNINHEKFTHYYKEIGTYTVCLKESNTCGTTQYCNQIELLPEDSLDFVRYYNYNQNPFEDQYLSAICSSADGGYYYVGTDDSYGSAGRKGLIVKINKFGNPIRTNIVNFPSSFRLSNIIETYNGDIVLSGNTQSTPARLYFGRIDSAGTSNTFISIGSNAQETVVKPIELKNGDLILSGKNYGKGFIMQTDAALNIKWYKKINELIDLRSVIEVPNGYLLAGRNTANELTVFKIDTIGNFIWSKSYDLGGASNAYEIIKSKDGNFLITGFVIISSSSHPIILKILPNGNVVWCNSYTPTPSYSSIYGSSISENSNGNIFIRLGLATNTNISIFQTDSLGNLLWASKLNNIGVGKHIKTQDDGIIIPATVEVGGIYYRPSIVKLSSNQQPICLGSNDILTKTNISPIVSTFIGTYTSTIPSFTKSYSNIIYSTFDTLICPSCLPTFAVDTQTACDSLIWIDGLTYTSSTNTPTFTLVGGAANGCDSLVTLNLTILNSATIDTYTVCDSLIWIDNVTYTSSTNTPTFTLTNINGCDSVVTLNLTVNSPTSDTNIITACDSIAWIDNVTYTSSTNTPIYTLTNAAGCDSVVTLNLTIINTTTGIDTHTVCDSLTWIDGITYTLSTNTPTFTIVGGAANGCDSVVTLNLTINSLNASYTSIDNGGGNFTFTNTSTGSFTQTHWAFGDGTTSTLANPTHTFNANGTFVVVLTINDSTTNNTCMDYYLDTLVVTGVVNPAPCVAGFVMYPDGNGNLVLVNSSTGNNLSYFWDFGDGDTSTMQFPSHTYATAGPFYLCLTVNDGVSCVDTYCDSIGINGVLFNKQTGFTINVIAPPVVVGVDEQEALATEVIIYPNPTTNEFVVELTNFSPSTQINIISVEGKMVYTNSSINSNKIIVDAANWSRGIYIVKITDKQSSKVMKLVKQ